MAYNDTPLANQRISDTQPLIRSNFQQIQSAISVNHVPIADGSGDQGKHKFIQMPVQVADAATLATETALYTKNAGATGLQLFFRKESNGLVFNMTQSDRATAGSGNLSTSNGYTYLPSGLLLKFGTATANNPGLNTITFPTQDNGLATIPAFTHILFGTVTPTTFDAANPRICLLSSYTDATPTQYVVRTNNSTNFTYFFIGY